MSQTVKHALLRVHKSAAFTLLILAALTGCTVGRDYVRPRVETAQTWRTPATGAGSLADLAWWRLFEDPALQQLIRTALEESRDLGLAVARVEEARARLRVTRASQFPQIDGRAGYANERVSEKTFPLDGLPSSSTIDPQHDVYRTGVDMSFELDLWGRLRRGTEAARADLLAVEENRHTVVTTVITDVAQAYFDLLELDREAAIARQTLESRRASRDLLQARFEGGLTPELDVRRAEQELAAAAATVPDVERRIVQTENRLSLLLGRNPGPIARGVALDAQTVLPEVPAGVPSALLERRPDIRQAERQLTAANARIGEAKAELFPRVTLVGTFGLESAALSDLFTGPARAWSVGPTVTWPIFNMNRLRWNVRANEARAQQALVTYQQTILQAFREVEDALAFQQKAGDIRAQRQARVTAAQRALDLAALRYRDGLGTYLDVLDAQRQLFTAEIELAASTRDQLTAVVQVYKALGGGWEER